MDSVWEYWFKWKRNAAWFWQCLGQTHTKTNRMKPTHTHACHGNHLVCCVHAAVLMDLSQCEYELKNSLLSGWRRVSAHRLVPSGRQADGKSEIILSFMTQIRETKCCCCFRYHTKGMAENATILPGSKSPIWSLKKAQLMMINN